MPRLPLAGLARGDLAGYNSRDGPRREADGQIVEAAFAVVADPSEPQAMPELELANGGPFPSPDLSPLQVVGIQLDTLRRNDQPGHDAGIAITFRFGRRGEVAAYDFTLSKDEDTGCWLTDGVMLAPVEMA